MRKHAVNSLLSRSLAQVGWEDGEVALAIMTYDGLACRRTFPLYN